MLKPIGFMGLFIFLDTIAVTDPVAQNPQDVRSVSQNPQAVRSVAQNPQDVRYFRSVL